MSGYNCPVPQWLANSGVALPNSNLAYQVLENQQPQSASFQHHQYGDVGGAPEIDQSMRGLSFANTISSPGPSSNDSIFSLPSAASTAPSTIATDTTISLGGGTRSSMSRPSLRALDYYYFDQEPIPCIFERYLGVPCDDTSRSTLEGFCDHVLSHFGNYGPPNSALCNFCDMCYSPSRDAPNCWHTYLPHVFSHLKNGQRIENMRADFKTVAYLRDKGIIPSRRYSDICKEFNEAAPSSARTSSSKEFKKKGSEESAVTVNTPIRSRRKEGGEKYHKGHDRSSGSSKHKKH